MSAQTLLVAAWALAAPPPDAPTAQLTTTAAVVRTSVSAPRYASLAEAPRQRDAELAQLLAQLPTLDDADRAATQEQLQSRLRRIRQRMEALQEDDGDPRQPVADRVARLDAVHLLSFEQDAVLLQLAVLGAGEPPPRRRQDAFTLGDDVLIGPNEQVRDAVALGGNVIVLGSVERNAVAIGGNVIVRPGGHVDGDTITVGGTVNLDPGATARPHTLDLPTPEPSRSWIRALTSRLVSLLGFTGCGVLTLGLFPEHVARVAEAITRRPGRAVLTGAFGALALALAAVVLAVTLIGLPLALMLLTLLGVAGVLGGVGACQALGDQLPLPRPHGRWAVFAGCAMAFVFLDLLPGVATLGVVTFGLAGVGAALATGFGRADR